MIEEERIVKCDQLDKYEYLEHYPSDQICDSDTCNTYFDVWKSLFIDKNYLTESFFEEHVIVSKTSLNKWNDGISYRICYKLNVGWAVAYTCDSFIILISENSNQFSSLPRNTLLTKDQAKVLVDYHAFSSRIDTVSSAIELRYESFDIALDSLISKAKVNTLCSERIFINDETET